MLGQGNTSPVAEYKASGEIERVYHEIRQTLRVSGVNLNFRTWAAEDNLLPVLWDAVRPNCQTPSFEQAADQLRTAAARAAASLGKLHVDERVSLGESQAFQVQAALKLYHYINPKLLLLTSAVQLALSGKQPAPHVPSEQPVRMSAGVPPRMYPMEMVDEKPKDQRQRQIFDDIQTTLSLDSINSDYRTLALWPEYLDAAWAELKPLVGQEDYVTAGDRLRELARTLAAALPLEIPLSPETLKAAGADIEKATASAAKFEQLLPGLILNMALCLQDWMGEDKLACSPFPEHESAEKNPASPLVTAFVSNASVDRTSRTDNMRWRDFQALQRVKQVDDYFISYVDQPATEVESSQDEPIILLHGIPTWGFLWRSVLPALAGSNRTLVPDLLGFGFSDRRDTFDRSIACQAEMINDWMQALNIERATIVGHDIGGGVALRLATLFPHRVSRLCLMNTVCYDSWPIELMLQFGHPWAHRKVSASTAIAGLRLALKSGFASKPDDELLDGLLAPYRTEVGKLSLVRNAAALNTNLTTEITHLLPRIAVPTLVLWGEDDKFGERLARDIPHAELVRIADARHFVMVDQPQQVVQHLQSFLAQSLVTSEPTK